MGASISAAAEMCTALELSISDTRWRLGGSLEFTRSLSAGSTLLLWTIGANGESKYSFGAEINILDRETEGTPWSLILNMLNSSESRSRDFLKLIQNTNASFSSAFSLSAVEE